MTHRTQPSDVAKVATTAILWGGKTVQTVLGVPMLDTGLSLIDNIVQACKQIPIQKRRVNFLVKNCEMLREVLLSKDVEGTLVEARARYAAYDLDCVRQDILKIPKYGLLKRFLLYADIGDELTELNDKIQRILGRFNVYSSVSTHVALKDVKDFMIEHLTDTRQILHDVKEDTRSMRELQRNPHLAAQIRATSEADLQLWKRAPEPIDPEDIAEFEGLLRSMELPNGVKVLTGQVTTSQDNWHDAGYYTNVYLGSFQGKQVAVKSAKASSRYKRALRRFSREVTVWTRLDHPNILPCFGLIEDEILGVCIISPWQMNGNLFQYLQRKPQVHRMKLLCDAAKGLEFLHCSSISHGNLKCSNILVSDEGHALLCDFKMAQLLDCVPSSIVSQMSKRAITRWSAPEIIRQEIGATRPTDIYAFAMTILEAITMKEPYHEIASDMDVEIAVGTNGIRPARPSSNPIVDYWMTDELWEFMNECWRKRQCARPVIRGVVEALTKLSEASC